EAAAVPQARPEAPASAAENGTTENQAAVETATAAAPAPVATASVPAGSYVVQIASLPSEAEAQKSYDNLSRKFADIIGGRGVDIRKAEIAGKGTYYRVRIPAGSREEANSLCSRYKGAGGSCLVTK
ncbi:MAG TPA: SPOR domain-containing protein, partial [Sinorhizobium sp.]|nr:SPOR domain-containing protein [Sinorhizobium sp.]